MRREESLAAERQQQDSRSQLAGERALHPHTGHRGWAACWSLQDPGGPEWKHWVPRESGAREETKKRPVWKLSYRIVRLVNPLPIPCTAKEWPFLGPAGWTSEKDPWGPQANMGRLPGWREGLNDLCLQNKDTFILPHSSPSSSSPSPQMPVARQEMGKYSRNRILC